MYLLFNINFDRYVPEHRLDFVSCFTRAARYGRVGEQSQFQEGGGDRDGRLTR